MILGRVNIICTCPIPTGLPGENIRCKMYKAKGAEPPKVKQPHNTMYEKRPRRQEEERNRSYRNAMFNRSQGT